MKFSLALLILFCQFSGATEIVQKNVANSIDLILARVITIEVQDPITSNLRNGNAVLIDNRASKFTNLFEREVRPLLSSDAISNAPYKVIHKLFLILKKICFYTNNHEVTRAYAKLLNMLKEKLPTPKRYAKGLQERFIADWSLTEARRAGLQYALGPISIPPLLQNISFSTSEKSSYVRVSEGKVTQKVFKPMAGKGYIVVIGSPFCNPSKRFVDWLNENREFKSTFKESAIWLSKQNGNIRFKEVVGYNKNNDVQYNYILRKQNWPEILNWNTPIIYFFDSNGDLNSQIVGWPSKGRQAELEISLMAIGLK